MRTEGTLKSWNDARGFGFITTANTHQDVFVHVSALPQSGRRPQAGERLSFEIETGPDGRKRATSVVYSVVYLDPSTTPAATTQPARSSRPQTRHGHDPRNRQGHARNDHAWQDRTPRRQRTSRSGSVFGWPMVLLTLLGGGAWLHQSLNSGAPGTPTTPASALAAHGASVPAPTPRFSCNSRQHCSQMTSCAEATWVLQHCPDTKMDGDHDGVPCEDSLCGH